MSIQGNFNLSFGRISNFTLGLDLGAQVGLSRSLGQMASAAGIADLFAASAMEAARSFAAFGGSGGLGIGAGFLPPLPPPPFGSPFAPGLFGPPMPFGGMDWSQSLQQAFAGYAQAQASFGGAGPLLGGWGGVEAAVGGMTQATASQLALGYSSQFGMAGVAGFAAQQTRVTTTPASFPSVKGDSFTSTLQPTNTSKGKAANAKALNVSGSSDVKKINQAIDLLGNASAKVSVAKPGEKSAPGKVVLSAEQVDAIRNAPTDAAAKELLRGYLSKETGSTINPNMNDKNGIRKSGSREALNDILGTKIKNGTEKNSGSSMVMDSMLESITKSVRGGDFGSSTVTKEYAAGALGTDGVNSFGFFAEGSSTMQVQNGSQALAIDVSSYEEAARKVAELASPLIFDLEGQGLQLRHSGLIEVDLDGDGKKELVSDLSAHIGLLVFDSKQGDDEPELMGRDMFGNNTDLSAYGIEGGFDDGFAALRALAERFELVKGDKQHLDAEDLLLLEQAVGLRMRVGGLVHGEDRTFARLGITRINLGNPDKTLSLEQSPEDMYGNKLMHQDGATFVVNGDERPYADIWFNVQARAVDTDVATAAIAGDRASTSALLASMRR